MNTKQTYMLAVLIGISFFIYFFLQERIPQKALTLLKSYKHFIINLLTINNTYKTGLRHTRGHANNQL